jgi:succinate dehydrogenase / fumarate reductase cytochrome b subunit
MSRERNVGVFDGFIYRGGGSMLAWLLHRISGLGMVIFVGFHVLASYLSQQFGSNFGQAVNVIYQSWFFQTLIFLFVLFHAINGLRIIILDLWPGLIQYQREAIWIEWSVFVPLYSIALIVIVMKALSGS